jgi:hypothetical protein
MSVVHGEDRCEVSVAISLNLTEAWVSTVIDVKLDDTVEQMAQVALTFLCESRLIDTTAMPIVLFPIHNLEDPMWKQCLEAMSNPEGPHFHTGMVVLAEYAHHMFNLQANTARTVTQQHLHLGSLEQHANELRHENTILCNGTLPPSDKDHELLVAYHRLSEVEHKWLYFHQQLDVTLKVLDERTHVIIHLEHHIEQQELKLEERAATIIALEQQLQVPPAPTPAAPAEPNTVSDVDEK